MQPEAKSVKGVPIRLTDKQWAHISEEHNELAGFRLEVLETIENPEKALEGSDGEHFAIRPIGPGKWLVVSGNEG